MNIVYCLDDNYVSLAEVSIQTVKKYNPSAKIIIVSEKPIEVNGADEYFVQPLNMELRHKEEKDRISDATYLKLLLTAVLPYDRVLFLDGDTICQKPLDELWNKDVKYMGVTEGHNYSKIQARALGLRRYALSGMLLMNLKNLREYNFREKCFKVLKECKIPDNLFQHEETAINLTLNKEGKLTFLDKKFNYCHNREYDNPIPEEKAVILHICGKDKSYMYRFMKYPELMKIVPEIKEKRVAIVGNSGIIFNGKWGKDIDDHDFIIRFNRGFIKDKECQGSKTSLLILACPMSGAEMEFFKPKYVANRSKSYINKADFTINSYERAVIKNSLGAQPSTGFMAVNICLSFGAKEIDLYGFSWDGISWPNDPKYKTLHDMAKEKEIILGWQNAGLLKIHK